MLASLSILCSLAMGAAACLSLASLVRDLRAMPSKWRALKVARDNLEN